MSDKEEGGQKNVSKYDVIYGGPQNSIAFRISRDEKSLRPERRDVALDLRPDSVD